ncbi:MAG: PhoX family phosphatase [Caulobacterales bacterium]
MTQRFQDIVDEMITRRGLLEGGAAIGLLSLAGPVGAVTKASPPKFAPVPANLYDTVTVPAGYEAKTLIAWGDPLFDSVTAPFNRDKLTRADQETRFGFNNDMLAVFPAAWSFPTKATGEGRFILCANNEYFDQTLMFGERVIDAEGLAATTEAAYAAMGVSIVQLENKAGAWSVIKDKAPGGGAINRRITPFTPVVFDGPAKAHPWIKVAGVKANELQNLKLNDGAVAIGTLANCAGGWTPWGTYLTAEENFQNYVIASKKVNGAEPKLEQDADVFGYGLKDSFKRPGHPAHLDLTQNPTAAALYGWIVEIDPYDPSWMPRKRTALGRKKGEAATTALSKDGRLVVYSGDDERNQFIYKFVSSKKFNPKNRTANRDLLSEGQLYVAQFNATGKGVWLKLNVASANAALKANGADEALLIADEADLMVRVRVAAAALGATPMDRPEDVECPVDAKFNSSGIVLAVCTNNSDAKANSPANPRRGADSEPNVTGHIVRIDESGQDPAATSFRWDIFALAGDPVSADAKGDGKSKPPVGAWIGGAPSFKGDRFACPDNIAFDGQGRVFIATDGSPSVFGDCNDGVLVTAVAGAGPRLVQRFLTGPVGCEICGPLLAPDARTFFCAIQHPGESDTNDKNFSGALFSGDRQRPFSSWPDGGESWPRPGVVYVRRIDGGRIGGD